MSIVQWHQGNRASRSATDDFVWGTNNEIATRRRHLEDPSEPSLNR